ncbi:hypothetical protein [Paenibacillus sp. FSL M7-0420]|uniref:hypothetical protein n=1 Tax=Paenibacillus sp. FSL M7-0420 TaxID=2921609 RepID=UPI0030FC2556
MNLNLIRFWLLLFFGKANTGIYLFSLMVIVYFNFQMNEDLILKISLDLLFIALFALQAANLSKRYQAEQFVFLSIISTNRKIFNQGIVAVIITSPVIIIIWGTLRIWFGDVPDFNIGLIALFSGFFAVVSGLLVGEVIRKHGLGILILITLYLTIGLIPWTLHEKFRYVSPVLNIYNPYLINFRNIISIFAAVLLFYGMATIFSYRRGGGKKSLITWLTVGIALCLFSGIRIYEYTHDKRLESNEFKIIKIGTTQVHYKGMSRDRAEKFGVVIDYLYNIADGLHIAPKRYSLEITQRYAVSSVEPKVMMKNGDQLIINIYSNKLLDFNYGFDWVSKWIDYILTNDTGTSKDNINLLKHQMIKKTLEENPMNIYTESRRQKLTIND